MRTMSVSIHIGAVLAMTAGATVHAQSCPWRPWFSDWAHLDSYNPGGGDLDPSNWDYLGTEPTSLGADGRAHTGSYALHFFSGNPASPGVPNGFGSGGVYQTVMAMRGTPINVSAWTKGAALAGGGGGGWFEVMIIEGAFNIDKADRSPNTGDFVFKRDTFPDATWADPSPTWMHATGTWNRWSSSTPAELTPVTVILKAGCVSFAGNSFFEVYFDDVVVSQGGGPNLVVNGNFEDAAQALNCQHENVQRDATQGNYYFGVGSSEVCTNGIDDDGDTLIDCADPDCASSPFCQCHTPFADADGDGDVDLDDFAEFQRCYTGPDGALLPGCACFDQAGPSGRDGKVDEIDLVKFLGCATRANVAAIPTCAD